MPSASPASSWDSARESRSLSRENGAATRVSAPASMIIASSAPCRPSMTPWAASFASLNRSGLASVDRIEAELSSTMTTLRWVETWPLR